ncbi:MAG: hypothetical protein U0636_02440 [Phycisphaerales bacterium]
MTHGLAGSGRARAARAVVAMVAAALLAAAAHAGDVAVELLRFGVGNYVRPGDPTAIQVRLTSSLTEPVQTRVQWELRNGDGDTALYSRDVALAPGAPTDRWLYGVLPIESSSALAALDSVSVVRVLQMDNGRIVRELAAVRINGQNATERAEGVEINNGLLGVLGDGRMGLNGYGPAANSEGESPALTEVNRIARGLTAEVLPDRWEGLYSYQALVWGSASVQNLAPDQARALLEWVRRGGNLIIVLTETTADQWGLLAGKGGRTALAEVLPQGGVQRHRDVPVAQVMPLLSKTPDLRNPSARTTLWTFDPALVGNGYETVLTMPCALDTRTGNLAPTPDTLEGLPVVVRRSLGFGTLSVVGVDADGLDRPNLNPDGLPQADIFWNRLMGRREDTPDARLYAQLQEAKRLDTRVAPESLEGGPMVNDLTGMPGALAIGLLGLVLAFGLYWVAAGPASYLVLRGMKRVQFAWLGFVLVAVTATVLVWLATSVEELGAGRVRHLTFLDRIVAPGQSSAERALVRAQTWMSAELPGYGPTLLALTAGNSAVGTGGAGSDTLWTWFEPPAGSSTSYPDTERYDVSASSPAKYEVPSRATSSVYWGSWIGEPSSEWGGTPNVASGSELRQDMIWSSGMPQVRLHGSLTHSLPKALENVYVLHVTPRRSAQRKLSTGKPQIVVPSAMTPNAIRIASVTEWEPGSLLDVGTALYPEADPTVPQTERSSRANALDFDSFLNRTFPTDRNTTGLPGSSLREEQRLLAYSIYGMLKPPNYVLATASNSLPQFGSDTTRIVRDMARTLDLAKWMTRPCLIVIGTLRDEDSDAVAAPFPFEIDGRAPRATGRTIVRSIFLLPDPLGSTAVPLPTP